MKILNLIRAQCDAQGVDKKYAERIEKIYGIEEEKDGNIQGAVKNFKEAVLPAIEEASEGSENAAQKAIESYEKKHGLKDGKPIDGGGKDEEEGTDEVPNPTSKLMKKIEELASTIESISQQQKKNSTVALVKEKLKGKIDDDFINDYVGQVDLDVEDIDKEVDRVVNLYTETRQKFINKAVSEGKYQPVEGSVSDEDFDDYLKMTSNDESEFQGVKI